MARFSHTPHLREADDVDRPRAAADASVSRCVDPRIPLVPGLLLTSLALFWYAALTNMDTPIRMFLLPADAIGDAGMWSPLTTTATRNLPPGRHPASVEQWWDAAP